MRMVSGSRGVWRGMRRRRRGKRSMKKTKKRKKMILIATVAKMKGS